jgi:uncharacterized membrane protein YgcG
MTMAAAAFNRARGGIAFWLFLFCWLAAPALAEERITRFVSDVTINVDGSLDVIETIAFNVEGERIRRGILRDFPTRYPGKDGNKVEVGFDIVSVKRDGRGEPYGLEDIDNGVRIKIGSGDVLLEPGPHVYEIAYRTTRQLGFFEGFDELYWNVTGNSWDFAIDAAEAIVRLPPGAAIIRHAAYTGPQGAKGEDFRVTMGDGSVYRAETTKRLEVREGFTVAVAFSKGIVTPPPPPVPPRDMTIESFKALAAGLAVVLFYYLTAWFFIGRDPPQRPIIPLFAPPPGLGPAGVRYVWKREFDAVAFAAAVIGLAAKGRLRIHGNGHYRLERLTAAQPPLEPNEAALYAALPKGRLELDDRNSTAIGALHEAVEASLARDFGGRTYHANRGWFWGGLVLSIMAIVPAMAFMRFEEAFLGLILVFVCGGAWALLLWLVVLNARSFMQPGRVRKIIAAVLFAAMLPFFFLAAIWPAIILAGVQGPALPVFSLGLLALIALHVLFFRWLAAATLLGRRLLDGIEGFRMYLTTAEEERLDALNPPQKTPELFERFLPYALALDCDNAWSEKFADVLAQAAYVAPGWYVGKTWDMGNLGDFTHDLDNSRYAPSSSSTSSSFSAPGSFSGSSGSGSSGGGGGGGGGSGW